LPHSLYFVIVTNNKLYARYITGANNALLSGGDNKQRIINADYMNAGWLQCAFGSYDGNLTGSKGLTQNLYALIAPLMDYQERTSLGVSISRLRYLMLDITGFQSHHKPAYTYLERSSDAETISTPSVNSAFTRQAVELKLRYAKGEKVTESLFGKRREPGKWPIVMVAMEQGWIQRANGIDNAYGRGQVALEKRFRFKWGGALDLYGIVEGIMGDVPITLLALPRGTQIGGLYVADPKAFQTLGPQSLLATQSAASFVRYVFKPLWMRKNDAAGPTPALRAGAGWGKLADAGRHTEIGKRAPFRAPFYEVGVEIARLYNVSGIGYGLGVYSRVANYHTGDNKQDIAFKLLLDLPY
jgi:hypothetical protein